MTTEFKVKRDTDPEKLSLAIFSTMRNCKTLELSCLGAGPVIPCIKAFIYAKAKAIQVGIKLHIDPIYRNVVVDKEQVEKTLIVFVITKEEEI